MSSNLGKLRRTLEDIPIIGPVVKSLYHQYRLRKLGSSKTYWTKRYASGGNSGSGSYGKFAQFKAEVLNGFVAEHQVTSVIEFGCGDGNQLRLAEYPQYIGFDVSPVALDRCREIFHDDSTKSFREIKEYHGEQAELTLSLDVIYHLYEGTVFNAYMRMLFGASTRYVIIYSSNYVEDVERVSIHVKHRRFTTWIDQNEPGWKLSQHIPNRYPPTSGPYKDLSITSPIEFYIFEKTDPV
jgi:SAM-dependent methyltransferase